MFTRARLKLTLWYLLIISIISFTFSLIIYRVVALEVHRFVYSPRLYRGPRIMINQIPIEDPELTSLVDEIRKRFLVNIIGINGGIIILSGSFAYFLAGRTLKPIQLMLNDQNRFISDASHEIRTPLTSLKSAFEVYLRDKNPTLKEAKSLIGESINEVDKLQNLSDGLLELTSYQHPDSTAKHQNLDIKTIISQSISEVKAMADKKRIKIKNNVINSPVFGDADKLISLFVILLDNAIKYSPDKSTIEVGASKDKNLIVKIKDQGIGVSKKDLPRIFDRFYRSDTARTKNGQGGYGLGLSIAKKIADLHHAKIEVESQVNRGSVFSVIFQN